VKRGDVVIAVARGEQDKPRPWVVVQGDAMAGSGCGSVLLCPTASDRSGILGWRVLVETTAANGLRAPSEIMVDKLAAVPQGRVREVIGQLDAATMRAIDRALLLVLGFS
jgi:mRNA interferase MazF